MHVAFLAPDTVAENLLEPHPHTNNTHPHVFIKAHIRLRTPRTNNNRMHVAEGRSGTKSIMLTLLEKKNSLTRKPYDPLTLCDNVAYA